MDIRGFIYRLVNQFPGPLRSPARWVADVIFGIWDDISGVLRRARPEWLRLDGWMRWFGQSVMDWATAVINVIRWVVRDWGPRVIGNAINSLVSWVQSGLNQVIAWAQAAFNTVYDWVARGINGVIDTIRAVSSWVFDRFTEIWDPLWTTVRRVALLLTDPKRFAEWAIGSIWVAFWRVADANIDAIAEWVWARREFVIGRFLARVEALIARIL